MKLYIKNMVSGVCKILVKEELKELGLHAVDIDLGEVEIRENIGPREHDQLKISLDKWGLKLMDDETQYDKRRILIEKIKSLIINIINYSEEYPKIKFSDCLSEEFGYDYPYMSHLFSKVMGTTIEHYIISQKIERVKQLLVYDEMSLSEIAFKMRYSSVAHLSSQFKEVTGHTLSSFKGLKHKLRIRPENAGVI